MKESDWKVFKQIKDKAIELFCSRALREFEAVITNENDHLHDRYLRLYKLVRDRDKKMGRLFDDHSRSKAILQLLAIRAEGLADESLLGKLSEETLKYSDPERLKS